ncbi:MAG: RagB/SusD family nutrient uptake outer membrane protein [Parabacteroides sp.]|nr:RagB/SusD family nutrient uptake outer membrane protein [Parabacteroides sp.]
MKKTYKIFLLSTLLTISCSDYLDVVPDNVATIDNAFTNRYNAEKFLFTCYSYLPNHTSLSTNPAFFGGYEMWMLNDELTWPYVQGGTNQYAYFMARDGQTANSPYINTWEGLRGGVDLWTGIRDCNIFLENIHLPRDIDDEERERWIAEVKFLKAYYHFYLFRQYGPIPIVDQNLPVSTDVDEVAIYRNTVEEVTEYIVNLLDEAAAILPTIIENTTEEMGRITKPIALALKAKLLTLVASPLFNGNSNYTSVVDNRGIHLFPQEYDANKWSVAAAAIKEAITCAEENGVELYYFKSIGFDNLSESTKAKLNIRGSVTERWNPEIIWGSTQSTSGLQKSLAHRQVGLTAVAAYVACVGNPTIRTVERFYSKNGVPIEEDNSWDYANRYDVRNSTANEKFLIKEGFTTAKLNFDREIRYYASLYFDGSMVYGNGVNTENDYSKINYTSMKNGSMSGRFTNNMYSATGYGVKKLVHPNSVVGNTSFTNYEFSFPIIRLSDLYLLYAEALNEVKSTPDNEVFFYIDKVRERASLGGVVESWANYSSVPTKPLTKTGMREIIHQERLIELAFEGQSYWDLLRWRKAQQEFSKPILGWNVLGKEVSDYYQMRTIFTPNVFNIKNYFQPIRNYELSVNNNLVQNYGW